ncbi:MAG: UDP-N-acetylmuramoyl-L-alanine--D-glutamate ligase [Alphaproteobacteria bacterium]|nr:UDP-N-acetylmuramoyl-L-alanine--D-glutamate ligase [Alphaproteobacteria bacterium]
MIDLSAYRGQTLAVMGLGRSGMATARALLRGGATVLAWDDSAARRDDAGGGAIPVADLNGVDWSGIDALVLSPGIPHSHPAPHPVAACARSADCRIIGDIELLVRALPDARYIGVTGTNGKSTTTTLIGHLLSQAGLEVQIGGNLGTPALELEPLGRGGTYVIEMSSYQLELTDPVPFDIAVLLNVSADHLDRHGGMDGYVAAKRRIFDGQQAGQTAILGADDDFCAGIAAALAGDGPQDVILISGQTRAKNGVYAVDHYLYDDIEGKNTPIFALADAAALPGTHNAQNACAAYAAGRAAGIAPDDICAAMLSYPGLAHRQELVARIDGVRYVNDSKATNADAASRALSCYQAIYWIAGGQAKEGGLDVLRPLLSHIRHAYLIGEAAPAIAEFLDGRIDCTISGDLDSAVTSAHGLAQRDVAEDRVVLLSPACASFDQFPNFEARGDSFCKSVAALSGSARQVYRDGVAA